MGARHTYMYIFVSVSQLPHWNSKGKKRRQDDEDAMKTLLTFHPDGDRPGHKKNIRQISLNTWRIIPLSK